MNDTRKSDDEHGDGPFPERRTHVSAWRPDELEHGPFERRRPPDRRALESVSESEGATATAKADRRRRRGRGRRKADVLRPDAARWISPRGRVLMRRLREPLIGLTLAGVAAPLINAASQPEKPRGGAGAKTRETTPGGGGPEAGIAAAGEMAADADEGVATTWAAADETTVREQTIDGAVTRYGIDHHLAEQIYDVAEKHHVEPDVAYGLVKAESTFRASAVSHVGARGLTQVMPRTAKWLDPNVAIGDLFRPDVNLELGFRYLSQLIDKYDGDLKKALTAYNRGPGTVDKILRRGGNPDNGYAGKVLGG